MTKCVHGISKQSCYLCTPVDTILGRIKARAMMTKIPNKQTRKAIKAARHGELESFEWDTPISNDLIRQLIDSEKAAYERLTSVEGAVNRMQQSLDRMQQTLDRKRRG